MIKLSTNLDNLCHFSMRNKPKHWGSNFQEQICKLQFCKVNSTLWFLCMGFKPQDKILFCLNHASKYNMAAECLLVQQMKVELSNQFKLQVSILLFNLTIYLRLLNLAQIQGLVSSATQWEVLLFVVPYHTLKTYNPTSTAICLSAAHILVICTSLQSQYKQVYGF